MQKKIPYQCILYDIIHHICHMQTLNLFLLICCRSCYKHKITVYYLRLVFLWKTSVFFSVHAFPGFIQFYLFIIFINAVRHLFRSKSFSSISDVLSMFIKAIGLVFLFIIRLRFPARFSIADVVRNRYGDVTLRTVCKFEKLDYKLRNSQLDLECWGLVTHV